MKKIIIVDDEVLVRVGIKSIVEWEKFGYQVVAEAANGEEALELIKIHQPNIVMTDLMMSPMDGFELIKRCKVQYPNVKFLVLSSYNDMDNVKRAMKLGAKDYLFKLKINAEGLLSILDEISKEVEETKQNTMNSLKNIPEVRQNLLLSIIEKGYDSPKVIEEKMKQLELRVSFTKPYMLFLLSIDDFSIYMSSRTIKDTNLLRFSIVNIIKELMNKVVVCDDYMVDQDIVLSMEVKSTYDDVIEKIKDVFPQISMYMKRYFGLSVSGSISDVYNTMEQVQEAISQNRKFIQQRLVVGQNQLFDSRSSSRRYKKLQLPYEGLSYQLESVISKEGQLLYQYIIQFFNKIKTLGSIPETEVRNYYLELYHGMNKNAQRYKIDLNSLLDDDGNTLYTVVMKGDTATTIQASFLSVASKLIGIINLGQEHCPRQDITKVKQYIRGNLDKELTVSSMSEMLGLNGSYFSHIFKKETGYKFVDYVNNTRIQRAKELLLTTDYRIFEIAKMVGIENSNYFSILFKKITGQSPNDIRGK